MKRPKLYRITALLLGAAVVLSAAGTGALAAGATQARNGEMAETTNGALTYWFPKYIAGCDDNTIAQATSNNLSIGGRRITRLSGHGSQYALIRTHTSSVVPFEAALEQLMLLPNGTYTLSAYVASLITEEDKANGAYAKVYVYADDGETALEREIGVSEGATAPWEPVEVPNVVITEGKCRIGFALKSVTQGGNATAGRALAVDGVTLIAADAAVIGGTVSAPTGAGVPYAQIEVLRDGVRVAAATTGNTSGAYADLSVPTGTDYTVRVTASGYEPVVRTGVDIVSAEPQTMDFAFVGYDDSTTYTFGGSDSEYGAEGGYYFDAVLGSDTNDGRSPETAWQTIDKFNATTFQPGDKILFHAGSVWTGVSLVPRGSGTEEAPIVVGKYGPADKMPAFHRNYVPDTPLSEMTANRTNPTLRINGVSHWEFNDLEITNYGQYNADDTHSAQTGRTAVTITSTTGQPDATMRGIRLNGLYVHDVNGANPKSGGGYNNASGSGITWGASGQSKIDGLIIENCLIKNITRNGIVGGGYSGSRVWSQGSGYAQSGVPIRHRNVVVRGNVLDTIAGDGILVSGTLRAVVEYNLVTKACNDPRPYPTLSGNATSNLSAAVWPFDADGTIFQYNEVCYAKVPRGTEVADGEAFDSDYYCTNSLYQYNYSHDNEGGCFMVCGPAYSYTDGTVFRYNISENDGSIYGKR
ncbi:MAG: carboxypeptidase-like regulatory domain-containing protein, partial [Oscillospiraceae bacterium]|nr:carboxypeptidase-like regulatory domain-containing protein [Oscillospiraceae bacterium]